MPFYAIDQFRFTHDAAEGKVRRDEDAVMMLDPLGARPFGIAVFLGGMDQESASEMGGPGSIFDIFEPVGNEPS